MFIDPHYAPAEHSRGHHLIILSSTTIITFPAWHSVPVQAGSTTKVRTSSKTARSLWWNIHWFGQSVSELVVKSIVLRRRKQKIGLVTIKRKKKKGFNQLIFLCTQEHLKWHISPILAVGITRYFSESLWQPLFFSRVKLLKQLQEQSRNLKKKMREREREDFNLH